MTSKNSRLLLISTGGADNTMYSKTFTTNRSLYNTIKIDAFSTPFFPKSVKRKNYSTHDEYAIASYDKWKKDSDAVDAGGSYDKEDYEWPLEFMKKVGVVTPNYEKSLREQWGSESIEYRQKVFAENCELTDRQLLTLAEMEKCWAKVENNLPVKGSHNYPDPRKGTTQIGVDVGFEQDRSCIVKKEGNVFSSMKLIEGSDSVKLGFYITERYEKQIQVNVDANGLGRGTYDNLKNMGHRCSPIMTASKPANLKFVNLRAELFWTFREAIRAQELWFLLSKDQFAFLVEEFTSIRYKFDLQGRIQIASKADIKKILKRSPDSADAVVLAIAQPSVDYASIKKRKAAMEAKRQFGDLGI